MKFITSIFTATSLLATIVSAKNSFITPVDGQKVKAEYHVAAHDSALVTTMSLAPGE